ncbi:hypothetical protein [Nisaea sp.]|uniref:hypothetical protein n=1 Tax=Nisaea sp. TaxID=2024842 RepID=UPI003296BA0D
MIPFKWLAIHNEGGTQIFFRANNRKICEFYWIVFLTAMLLPSYVEAQVLREYKVKKTFQGYELNQYMSYIDNDHPIFHIQIKGPSGQVFSKELRDHAPCGAEQLKFPLIAKPKSASPVLVFCAVTGKATILVPVVLSPKGLDAIPKVIRLYGNDTTVYQTDTGELIFPATSILGVEGVGESIKGSIINPRYFLKFIEDGNGAVDVSYLSSIPHHRMGDSEGEWYGTTIAEMGMEFKDSKIHIVKKHDFCRNISKPYGIKISSPSTIEMKQISPRINRENARIRITC